MTGRRTTRIAALGAGALLTLGFLGVAPAGASDGAQADASVSVGTADVVSQTLNLVNQACVDAANVGDTATSALASGSGITVASQSAGTGLNLSVSLPALTQSLPVLGSLPLLGSVTGQVDAEPLEISCAASANGTSVGVSAAGVEALVEAIAPGVDVSSLIPSANVAASAASGSNPPATSVSATATPAPAPAAAKTTVSSSASAAADPAAATTAAAVSPASSSNTAGNLARTGAGLGALGLLGTALIGSGRLLGLGRKLLRIG